MNIPWYHYNEAPAHTFDCLRFSEFHFDGYDLYQTFDCPAHFAEAAHESYIIQSRCYIYTEEAYKAIRESFPQINGYLRWMGCNSGDNAILTGMKYGCYEWETLTKKQKAERKNEYEELKKRLDPNNPDAPEILRTIKLLK